MHQIVGRDVPGSGEVVEGRNAPGGGRDAPGGGMGWA